MAIYDSPPAPPPPVIVARPPAVSPPPLQYAPPPPIAPPPLALLFWTPGTPSCNGTPETPVRIETPAPTRLISSPSPLTFRFRIDAQGRPHGIAHVPDKSGASWAYARSGSQLDLEPALAGSVFTPGAEGRVCQITYRALRVEMAKATASEMLEWLSGTESLSPLNRPLFDPASAFYQPEDTCSEGAMPRVVYFAPFDEIAAEKGHFGTGLTRFDIDANGVPTNVRMVYSTMTTKGDAAAVEAARKSRFAKKAVTGCFLVHAQPPGAVVEAPQAVDPAIFAPKDATCPPAANSIVHVSDVPFPDEFSRRAIEGWVIVGFDITPDGQVTNARALRAEPAAAFGAAALKVINAAWADPTEKGYNGCVTRIVFKLDDDRRPGVYNGG